MPAEIRVPIMGESVVEATVGRWFKQEGDALQAGEPVVELETDKVNLEVGAEQAGVLVRILAQSGQTVAIGDVLGEIGPVGQVNPASGNGQHKIAPTIEPARAPQPAPPAPEPAAPPAQITPIARRVAEERGVDIARVHGTGPGGRVTKEDVIKYAEDSEGAKSAPKAPSPAAPPAAPRAANVPAAPGTAPAHAVREREERVRMTRRRQTIAQRLVEAQQTAALLTTFNEIDMRAVMEMRARRKEAFKERHGVGLGFMSFFTRAVIGALKAFPRLNAELQGDEIVLKHYYDIGIAVSTEGGLVVPVLREADRMNFAEIEGGIADLARRAREGTLALEDLRGGTFSITNGGIFGSLLSTPILNPPQAGILGMHKIQERPVAVAGQVVIRPMMYVALTYDHRIVDGQEAVQFLVKVKELLEEPEALLLEG